MAGRVMDVAPVRPWSELLSRVDPGHLAVECRHRAAGHRHGPLPGSRWRSNYAALFANASADP